jgi:hypothetical protein
MLEVLIIKTSEVENFSVDAFHEVVIVMPAVKMNVAKALAAVLTARANYPGLLIIAEDDRRFGFIYTANLIYRKTNSKYFTYIAQDSFPGKFWLAFAIETIKHAHSGLLAFNDGKWFGKVASFGLVDRNFTNSLYNNFLFYPEYIMHCADVELSILAQNTNNLAYNPNCIMLEVDYTRHLRWCNNKADDELFHRRQLQGFPTTTVQL